MYTYRVWTNYLQEYAKKCNKFSALVILANIMIIVGG